MAERRYTVVLYGALLIAALATYGAYGMITSMREQSRVLTRPVVTASRDVPEGAAFDRTALAVRDWPAATVPAGAFSASDSVVGRVASVSVFAGEPIVPGRLAPTGAGAGLETKIRPGQRAMAVRINDVAGISGLLQPNSRVDVMVTLNQDEAGGEQVAKLFMENMRVLSVGTAVQRDEEGRPINATTVTLGVTPDEAERLAVAQSHGNIQLVLRGYGDPDTVATHGATSRDVLAQLRGAPAVAAPAPAPRRIARADPAPQRPAPLPEARAVLPESVKVDVYRGDKTTRQTFEKQNEKPAPSQAPKTP